MVAEWGSERELPGLPPCRPQQWAKWSLWPSWADNSPYIRSTEIWPCLLASWHIFAQTLMNIHWHIIFPCRRIGSVRVEALRRSRQRHPSSSVLRARGEFNASLTKSPSYCCFTVSSSSVGLFETITMALWPTVTIRRNGFIGYALASWLQCDRWRCENLSSHSFYLRAKCNSLSTNYTHHCKLPDLWGYWQSIAHCICLLSYY